MKVLARKLEGMGARVVTRLGKEVTHIVFQRQRSADKEEQDADDVELRSLYDKAAKVWLLQGLCFYTAQPALHLLLSFPGETLIGLGISGLLSFYKIPEVLLLLLLG